LEGHLELPEPARGGQATEVILLRPFDKLRATEDREAGDQRSAKARATEPARRVNLRGRNLGRKPPNHKYLLAPAP
jgi:hypothetical protein